jgi:SAM-dependent methyltransferase
MPNAEMAEYWNGRSAEVWVSHAERFDTMLGGFGRHLLVSADLKPGERVLDVGCGNGAISCDAALAVAPGGSVTGVDLSAPMLAKARQRAEERGVDVLFKEGDAQTATFSQPFDVIVSRFGVMFFEDPVAAFANLARACRSGGRLRFVCWQEMLVNEWIAVPAMAMVAHVGIPDLPAEGAPGPFALADAERTGQILEAAGWSEVSVEEHRAAVRMGSDPRDVVDFLFSDELGRRLVDGKDPQAVAAGTEAALQALGRFVSVEGVVLSGASWLVSARRS